MDPLKLRVDACDPAECIGVPIIESLDQLLHEVRDAGGVRGRHIGTDDSHAVIAVTTSEGPICASICAETIARV